MEKHYPVSVLYLIPGLTSIPQQTTGVVMVEARIPCQNVRGDYRNQIMFGDAINETVALNLKVWDCMTPTHPSIVFDFNSYSGPVRIITQDNKNHYLPSIDETSQAGHTPSGLAQCNWTYWDRRFGPMLERTIFDDMEPAPYFYLPFNLHWPWGSCHDQVLVDCPLEWRVNP